MPFPYEPHANAVVFPTLKKKIAQSSQWIHCIIWVFPKVCSQICESWAELQNSFLTAVIWVFSRVCSQLCKTSTLVMARNSRALPQAKKALYSRLATIWGNQFRVT